MLVASEAAVEQGFVGAISVVYEHLFRHVSCLFLLRCKVSKIIVQTEVVTDFFGEMLFMRDAAEVIPAITQKTMKRHAASNTMAAASSVNSRFIQT